MPSLSSAKRAVVAVLKFVLRLLRILFILGLVILPVPIAVFMVAILDRNRRNLPAEVLRKK